MPAAFSLYKKHKEVRGKANEQTAKLSSLMSITTTPEKKCTPNSIWGRKKKHRHAIFLGMTQHLDNELEILDGSSYLSRLVFWTPFVISCLLPAALS